jgi:hypothetical protein
VVGEACVSKLIERFLRECASVCENVGGGEEEREREATQRRKGRGEQRYCKGEGALMS